MIPGIGAAIGGLANGDTVPPPVNTVAPAISGNTFIGDILSSTAGTWTGTGISYAYQWNRGGSPIGGATGATHEIASADAGAVITCTVTASTSGGSASATSSGTSAVSALLDGLSPTAAWSMGRDLVTAFIGSARYTTATGVNSLKDQSGNSRHLAQGNTSLQPAATTGGTTSRACADFDGSGDILVGGTLSTFIANNAGYIVASFLPDAITINNGTVENNHGIFCDGGGFMGIFVRNTDATVGNPDTVSALNWDGNRDIASSVSIIAGTAYVVEWKHESGNVSVRVNGGTWVDVASGNTTNLTNTAYVGGRGTGNLDGKIFEMAAFSSVPSSGTRDAIAADFKTWLGI